MEEAKEVLKSLLRTSVHESSEDLDKSPLNPQEKRQCLSNGTFDIDFCAFSGLAENILNDPALSRILSNLSGTFVKSPYNQRLNGYRHQKVLVICDIKPFKLALSVTEGYAENDDELTQVEGGEVENDMQQSSFAKNVADLLDLEKGKTFAFRDIKSRVSTAFHGFELICYQFGQKQDIELFLAHVDKMGPETKLGVAVGLELFLDKFMLLCAPENVSIGECFYPMLLSRDAGSILCPLKHAIKFAQNSKRCV
jgi:hypothetical protein